VAAHEATKAKPWAASAAVKADELRVRTVGNAECLFRSLSARTTGASIDLTEMAEWVLVSQSTTPDFDTPVNYPSGFKLVNSGAHYERLADGAGGATFTASEWLALGSASAAATSATVTAGGAFTIATDRVFVNPAATLATWVPTFPAGTDDQQIRIYFGGTLTTGTVVTAVTWPATLLGSATYPAEWLAGESAFFRFSTVSGVWRAE
jgi:hypothetical protein